MTITDKILRAKADYDAVYEAGKNAGGGGGQGSYDEGYAAGQKAEYDAFWGEYQYVVNGVSQRTSCAYMFAYSGWNDKTFKPKYSMPYISNAGNMFNTCGATDIKGILEKQGVVFDFSKSTTFNQAFAYSKITRLPTINTRSASAISSAFNQSTALEEVHIILKDDGTQTFSNTFYNCKSLSSLTVEGVIGQSIDFSVCPLTKASIESIMAALSTTTNSLTVTLSKTAVNNAFTDEEWTALVSQHANWTISLI